MINTGANFNNIAYGKTCVIMPGAKMQNGQIVYILNSGEYAVNVVVESGKDYIDLSRSETSGAVYITNKNSTVGSVNVKLRFYSDLPTSTSTVIQNTVLLTLDPSQEISTSDIYVNGGQFNDSTNNLILERSNSAGSVDISLGAINNWVNV